MNEVPLRNPATPGDLFVGLSPEQVVSRKNNKEQLSLFREVKRYVEKGDKDAAISSLSTIIRLPGLESWRYNEAYHFLNKLFAFSEKYFELYGSRYW